MIEKMHALLRQMQRKWTWHVLLMLLLARHSKIVLFQYEHFYDYVSIHDDDRRRPTIRTLALSIVSNGVRLMLLRCNFQHRNEWNSCCWCCLNVKSHFGWHDAFVLPPSLSLSIFLPQFVPVLLYMWMGVCVCDIFNDTHTDAKMSWGASK